MNKLLRARRTKFVVLFGGVAVLVVAAFFLRRFYSPRASINVTVNERRTTKVLWHRSKVEGYSYHAEHARPPELDYMVCNVTITYDGPEQGPLRCSPDSFKIIANDEVWKERSLIFPKSLTPREINPVPEIILHRGDQVSGELVFHVKSSISFRSIEYFPLNEKRHFTHPIAIAG